MIGRGIRKRRTQQPRPAAPEAKSTPPAQRNAGEPVSFAWTEPIDRPHTDQAKPSEQDAPRVVLVGRGPSLVERLALAAPSPTTIAAGAAVLLVAVTGLALMSPSGEQATAGRSTSQYGDASAKTPTANVGLTKEEFAALEGESGSADNRDPFVGKGYGQAKRAADARARRTADAKRRQLAARKAAERRAKLAAARAPKYLGDFVYYSDYTPWERLKGTPGGWLQFDGQQTLMVESVTAGGAELFVVSDVEVINDRGRGFEYSYPLRRLKVKPGAIVRLADYRDVQGDDVTYTLRYRGPLKNPKHHE
jgi:hypothetical protein